MGHTHSFFISECIPGVNQEGNLGRTDPKLWLFSFSYAKILSPVPLVKFKQKYFKGQNIWLNFHSRKLLSYIRTKYVLSINANKQNRMCYQVCLENCISKKEFVFIVYCTSFMFKSSILYHLTHSMIIRYVYFICTGWFCVST